MTVLLGHHSGPVVVAAASNSHILNYLAVEKIHFKVNGCPTRGALCVRLPTLCYVGPSWNTSFFTLFATKKNP